MPKKLWRALTITIWIAFFCTTGLIYYVNHYLPHGPSYSTGDVVCQNDDRGPCAEKYIEYVEDLPIPTWAKFMKRSEGMLLWFGLAFAGVIMSGWKKED